jgi:hypothetical protein
MLKFIVKIWPAFLPILVYIFWTYVVEGLILERLLRRKKIIDGEKLVGEKSEAAQKVGMFSLKNQCFVTVLYVSLAMAIFTLVMSAFS